MKNIDMNAGFHYLYFALNNNAALEPRVGLNWNFANEQSLGIGIGKHSQTEYLSVYFQMAEKADGTFTTPNTKLDFLKAVHYVLSYNNTIIQNLHFRTELYYQHLYDIPLKKSPPFLNQQVIQNE